MAIRKLPKGKVTVDKLLFNDQMLEGLEELYKNRAQIREMIVLYTDENGERHQYYDGTRERLLWLLETAKLSILMPNDEE